jgi:hypothetical protein
MFSYSVKAASKGRRHALQKRGAKAAKKAIVNSAEDEEFLKGLKAEFKKMTGNKGAMAKLDLELYEAEPEVEIDIKAAMEGLRNEAPIFAKLLDALV